jgi:hypothetical protein
MKLPSWVQIRITKFKVNQITKNVEKARLVAKCLFIITPSVEEHIKNIRETTAASTAVDLKYCLTDEFYKTVEANLRSAYNMANTVVALKLVEVMPVKDLRYAYKVCTSKRWQPVQKAFNITAAFTGTSKSILAAAFEKVQQDYLELINKASLARGCNYRNYLLPIE